MRFFSMWFMVFATASVSWGAPIVSNGSFEQTDAQGRPDGWRMLFHRNSPGRFSVQKDAADGGRLLRITNPSGKAVPHVYSQLYQLVPLKPDTDYMFRFRVRGKEPRALTWALGKNWKIRFPINGITEEWQTFSFFLRVPADLMNTPESCELCLITEDRADGVELDDVEIIPMPDAIVRNGDFCGVRGGNVPCWQIGRNRNVNLGAGLDGKGVLTIRNYGFAADGVYGALYQRRADMVGFVNGIPLLFVELKNHNVEVEDAFNQNYRDYLDTIPQLFYHNAFIMFSNGLEAMWARMVAETSVPVLLLDGLLVRMPEYAISKQADGHIDLSYDAGAFELCDYDLRPEAEDSMLWESDHLILNGLKMEFFKGSRSLGSMKQSRCSNRLFLFKEIYDETEM